ncbi:hypothetical protein [Rhizohabitans arisaemae]|nr:hypothetical protein [Rhizohabitans arisaemae]
MRRRLTLSALTFLAAAGLIVLTNATTANAAASPKAASTMAYLCC